MFAIRLKELRQEKGLNQMEFAKAIGYSQSQISQWEMQINEPKASAIIALALYFDVSTDYLLGLEDESGKRVTVTNSFNNSTNINFKA